MIFGILGFKNLDVSSKPLWGQVKLNLKNIESNLKLD